MKTPATLRAFLFGALGRSHGRQPKKAAGLSVFHRFFVGHTQLRGFPFARAACTFAVN